MTIAVQTPWREIGAVPESRYVSEFARYDSPMLLDVTAIHRAAGKHSALALAMAHKEQKYASLTNIPLSYHNPLSISSGWANGGHTWYAYPSWEAGVKDWVRRLTDPAGPYAETITLDDLINVYAPPIENDTGLYVRQLVDLINAWQGDGKDRPVVTPKKDAVVTPPVLPPIVVTPRTITHGRVPHPPFIDALVQKPAGDGQGHTVVAPRQNVGTCVHFWGGNAWTDPAWKSIHGLFAGERLWDALTDYSVQRDGTIVRLNDPRGTRSPYASGGGDRLAGDGPAFVRTFGPGAVNSKLVSIETEGNGQPMPPAQVESLSALVAYWSDDAGISWEAFPLHPKYGIVTQLQHFETGKAGCPGGGVRGQTDAYQDRARAIMRQYQAGTSPTPPVPPPTPVTPVVPYSAKADLVFLTERFGTLVRYDADGLIIGQATYDPNGIISASWVQRCDVEDVWPSATYWMTGLTGAVKQRVRFQNGWALNDLGQKQGWRWAGRESPSIGGDA